MTTDVPNDGWEEHKRSQLRARLATTPAQRLAWLEDAIAFARKVGALPTGGGESVKNPD